MNANRRNHSAAQAAGYQPGWRRLLATGAIVILLLSLTGLLALTADQSYFSPEPGIFIRWAEDGGTGDPLPPACAGSVGLCTPVIDREQRAVV